MNTPKPPVRAGWIPRGFLAVILVLVWAGPAYAKLDECERALMKSLYGFYNSTQLRFNVASRPNEVYDPAAYAKPISIWELPEASEGVTFFGTLQGSPLVTTEGKVRIYNHRMKSEDAPGLPVATVTVDGATQSSIRTFAATPEDEYPYFVKFSIWTTNNAPTKILNPHYLQHATARSGRFLNDPEILPDRAAIAYDGKDPAGVPTSHLFLYRDGHFTRGLIPPPQKGDTLMVLSALLSKPFLSSPEALEHFPDLTDAYEDGKFVEARAVEWVARKVGPVIGDIVFKSTFLEGVHFELHAQNEDILFDSRGRTKSFFVRDLFDAVDDPALLLVEGKDVSQVRELDFFGFLNQIEAPFPPNASYWQGSTVHSWYSMWFTQINAAANFASWAPAGGSSMESTASARLIERFLGMLRERGIKKEALRRYEEFGTVFGSGDKDYEGRLIPLIGDLRDLWIKYRLDQAPVAKTRSAESSRIREALLAAKHVIASNEFHGKLEDFRKIVGELAEPPVIAPVPLEDSAVFQSNYEFFLTRLSEIEEGNKAALAAAPSEEIQFGELAGKPFARIRKRGGVTFSYFIGI